MKYQVLFSLENNEKVFINVVCCSHDWHFKGYCDLEWNCITLQIDSESIPSSLYSLWLNWTDPGAFFTRS